MRGGQVIRACSPVRRAVPGVLSGRRWDLWTCLSRLVARGCLALAHGPPSRGSSPPAGGGPYLLLYAAVRRSASNGCDGRHRMGHLRGLPWADAPCPPAAAVSPGQSRWPAAQDCAQHRPTRGKVQYSQVVPLGFSSPAKGDDATARVAPPSDSGWLRARLNPPRSRAKCDDPRHPPPAGVVRAWGQASGVRSLHRNRCPQVAPRWLSPPAAPPTLVVSAAPGGACPEGPPRVRPLAPTAAGHL